VGAKEPERLLIISSISLLLWHIIYFILMSNISYFQPPGQAFCAPGDE